jgi:hypothetical protein
MKKKTRIQRERAHKRDFLMMYVGKEIKARLRTLKEQYNAKGPIGKVSMTSLAVHCLMKGMDTLEEDLEKS